MKTIKGRITCTEEMLGLVSGDPNIYTRYIAENAPTEDKKQEEVQVIEQNLEDIDNEEDKDIRIFMTVFPRDEDGDPFFWDYQIKGFFKDSCGALRKVTGSECSKIKAYKKMIDGTLFIEPRKIKIVMPEGASIGMCQRPLRASTAQGERVALAASETVPAGSYIELEIILFDDSLEPMVLECLRYGARRGLGRWRNSGKGSFVWEQYGKTSKEKFSI